jgi:hypothetical protein
MTFEETVYETQPKWLAGAFAVIVMACSSIVPTYWGWWRLGRPVSMSPLEIAKAFDAPLMQHADPNGSAADHLRTVGDMRVRYGSHVTVVEQRESDATERLSHRPKIDSSSNTSVVERSSSDDVVPVRSTIENGSVSDTPTTGPARSDDDIELQMLASTTARMLSDQETTARVSICSDPFRSNPETETQADSPRERALETGPASPRIRTRIEMRLKFAEE